MNSESTGKRPGFSTEDARRVGEAIGIDWDESPFDVEQFRKGWTSSSSTGFTTCRPT